MSTSNEYSTHSALISSYLKESSKRMYRGFLDVYRDKIIELSFLNNADDLNESWTDQFLEKAGKLLEEKDKKILEAKMYWESVVKEVQKRDKENQAPMPTKLKRKRKATEEILTIWYLVNGDPFATAFPVDISDSSTIGHFKNVIRKNINAPDNKVNLPLEEVEENAITLDNIEVKRKLLIPTMKIYNVFDKIPESNVQFIVKMPATTGKYCNTMLYNKQCNEKDENVSEICKMPCPSTSAFPRRWKECNENPLKYIIYDLQNAVLEFCHIVGQIYKNEGDRQCAFWPFFTKIFDGIQPISIATDNGSIDDDVLLTDNEYKNEIGTGGKDSSIQGGCCLAKYWAQLQTVKICNNSCCPSIILAIAGPWFCVLGAVYLEKPVIKPLNDFILIADRPEDDGKRVKELAVFFKSLRLAFRTLDNYYKNLKELNKAEIEKIQKFFPYRNQYQIDENEIKFTYLYKLTEKLRDLTWKNLRHDYEKDYARDITATQIQVIRLFLSVFVTMRAHCKHFNSNKIVRGKCTTNRWR
ncbi:431_t:CDS:10, partial [Gigaspora margarita]